MPLRPPTYRPHGSRTKREHDRDRKSRDDRGYNADWRRARLRFLAEHPLCAMCEREDRVTAATIVDHVVPHRGDDQLFWNPDNWQALCKPHHDSAKQREERQASRRA